MLVDEGLWLTRLLKEDNDKIFADPNGWREKNGLVGRERFERNELG